MKCVSRDRYEEGTGKYNSEIGKKKLMKRRNKLTIKFKHFISDLATDYEIPQQIPVEKSKWYTLRLYFCETTIEMYKSVMSFIKPHFNSNILFDIFSILSTAFLVFHLFFFRLNFSHWTDLDGHMLELAEHTCKQQPHVSLLLPWKSQQNTPNFTRQADNKRKCINSFV